MKSMTWVEKLTIALIVGLILVAGVYAKDPYPLSRDSCGPLGNIMADVATARIYGMKQEQIRPLYEANLKACIEKNGADICVGGTPSELTFIESTMDEAWDMATHMSAYEVGKHFYDECLSSAPALLPEGIKSNGPQIKS
jgi:hypothetical protein